MSPAPVKEYNPEDDPLMGRLVAVLDGDIWKKGVVAYCDTDEVATPDGAVVEVGTDRYRVFYGSFMTTEDAERALRVKKKSQKVRDDDEAVLACGRRRRKFRALLTSSSDANYHNYDGTAPTRTTEVH